jgi:hypothetical protein
MLEIAIGIGAAGVVAGFAWDFFHPQHPDADV